MTIEYQDSDIIILDSYEWTGSPDGIYFKSHLMIWEMSTVGNTYRVLLRRNKKTLIQVENEFYQSKYQAFEPNLVGDVLILGLGLGTINPYLTTGTSWKFVDKNTYLISDFAISAGRSKHQGDAEDMVFLATLGTFDTIMIDFPQTQLNDYSSLLNIGGTIIEFKL